MYVSVLIIFSRGHTGSPQVRTRVCEIKSRVLLETLGICRPQACVNKLRRPCYSRWCSVGGGRRRSVLILPGVDGIAVACM